MYFISPWRVLKRGSDRQKLLRKIRQIKRQLEDEEISSKVRKALKAELFDLRAGLNYVMVYFSNAMQLAFLQVLFTRTTQNWRSTSHSTLLNCGVESVVQLPSIQEPAQVLRMKSVKSSGNGCVKGCALGR